MEVWDGFECEKFVFDGRNAIAVFPKNVCCMLIDAPVLNFCDYPGRLLELEYKKYSDLLTVMPREYRGHHPHGTVWNMDSPADLLYEKARGKKQL